MKEKNCERKPTALQPIPAFPPVENPAAPANLPSAGRIDLLALWARRGQKEAMRRMILLLAILCPPLIHAELPPSAYERMQKSATDVVDIEVLRVDIEPGEAPGSQKIHLMALINKVTLAANMKVGDLINIRYTFSSREKGWSGPGEIPVLGEKEKTLAYLIKDAASDDFYPAAGVMSVRNF